MYKNWKKIEKLQKNHIYFITKTYDRIHRKSGGLRTYSYVTYHVEIKICFTPNIISHIFTFLFYQHFMLSPLPKNSEKIVT